MGEDFHLLMQSLAKSLLTLVVSIGLALAIGHSCGTEDDFVVEGAPKQ